MVLVESGEITCEYVGYSDRDVLLDDAVSEEKLYEII